MSMVCVAALLLGSSVLRRPSFEEKYRCTSSPAGSVSSRSDSPSAACWDASHQPCEVVDSSSMCRTGVSRDVDLLSTAARPFVAVTSRTRSPAVVSSRPVAGPTRQFITSPPAPAMSHGLGVSCVTTSSVPAVMTSSVPAVMASSPSVSCVSVSVPTLTGFQIASATALPPAQLGYAMSPLDCRHDVTVTSSSVVRCTAPLTSTSSPVAAAARSSRPPTIVLQQVHSWEVAWPSAQKATAPALTRVSCDSVTDSCHDVTVTVTLSDLCHVTPASVTSSSVSFALPYDWPTRHIVSVSPLSHVSSQSSSPSADILPPPPELLEKPQTMSEKPHTLSEKPPPPYPGCAEIESAAALRREPTDEVTSMSAVDRDLCQLSAAQAVADTDSCRAANESTDEDVTMTTECQRIESPKPVRRSGDDSRCETKVPADYLEYVNSVDGQCDCVRVCVSKVPAVIDWLIGEVLSVSKQVE